MKRDRRERREKRGTILDNSQTVVSEGDEGVVGHSVIEEGLLETNDESRVDRVYDNVLSLEGLKHE
jgi:hypothetical protein